MFTKKLVTIATTLALGCGFTFGLTPASADSDYSSVNLTANSSFEKQQQVNNYSLGHQQNIDDAIYTITTTLNNTSLVKTNLTLDNEEKPDASNLFVFCYIQDKHAYVIGHLPAGDSTLRWNGSEGVGNLEWNDGEFPGTKTDEDYWILEPTIEKDTYYIKNKKNPDYVLDVHDGKTTNGTPLKAAKKQDPNNPYKAAQIFKLKTIYK